MNKRAFKKYVRCERELRGILKKRTKTNKGRGCGQAYLYVRSVKKFPDFSNSKTANKVFSDKLLGSCLFTPRFFIRKFINIAEPFFEGRRSKAGNFERTSFFERPLTHYTLDKNVIVIFKLLKKYINENMTVFLMRSM